MFFSLIALALCGSFFLLKFPALARFSHSSCSATSSSYLLTPPLLLIAPLWAKEPSIFDFFFKSRERRIEGEEENDDLPESTGS